MGRSLKKSRRYGSHGKRICGDSDALELEPTELYFQTLDSRKSSSSSPGSRMQVAEEMKNRKVLYHEYSVQIAYAGFRANRKQGDSKEYSQRQVYADKRWIKMLGKNKKEWYLGLKPNSKKRRQDRELRIVQFIHQYNDYDQQYDENFALLKPHNDERTVEFNRRACNSHTVKGLRWKSMDEFEKKLFTLDSRQWVKEDIEGPKQYPEGLEAKFRELRSSTLEAPEPAEPLDRLVKNGKNLTDT